MRAICCAVRRPAAVGAAGVFPRGPGQVMKLRAQIKAYVAGQLAACTQPHPAAPDKPFRVGPCLSAGQAGVRVAHLPQLHAQHRCRSYMHSSDLPLADWAGCVLFLRGVRTILHGMNSCGSVAKGAVSK